MKRVGGSLKVAWNKKELESRPICAAKTRSDNPNLCERDSSHSWSSKEKYVICTSSGVKKQTIMCEEKVEKGTIKLVRCIFTTGGC